MASTEGLMLTNLSYLFSHENGRAVAHCLELDLVSSGATLEQAEASLNAIVLVQIGTCYKSGNWDQLVKAKAPFEYFQALETAKTLGRSHLNVEVPPIVLPVDKKMVALPVFKYERELIAA